MPPARFLADVSLDLVARRLRALGYDVRTVRGARLEELLEAARAEQRIALTPSARRPPRFADVAAVTIPRDDPAAAVRTIAAAYEASGLSVIVHRVSSYLQPPGGESGQEIYVCVGAAAFWSAAVLCRFQNRARPSKNARGLA